MTKRESMAFWIFKVAEQELYPDIPGIKYVFDNTHSVRIKPGDVFIYLDKRKDYAFTGTGIIGRLGTRSPTAKESERSSKVRTVFTAHLKDMIWFLDPLSISPTTKKGKKNRVLLGITDVNLLGWSQSMPSLSESMYQSILDLCEAENLFPLSLGNTDFSIPDNWGQTKVRRAVKKFSDAAVCVNQNETRTPKN